MPDPAPTPPESRWPAILGWLTTAAFLTVAIPLFIRMPLWCDVTLYKVAARSMLEGGVHYRDVFDTNPPGFVWLTCGIHVLLGTSSDAMRIADLAIVGAVVVGLLVWARKSGASRAGVAWLAAAIAAFYPLTYEFNHAQRDVWMMLPAILAIGLRLRRVQSPQPSFWNAILEGMLWGLGCWIKPHVIFIAAIAWLVTAGRFGSRRQVIKDFAATFSGGLFVGLAGLAWLVGTGTLFPFLDVWRNWNSSYLHVVLKEIPFKYTIQLDYFPPYSVFVLLAIPLAMRNLRDRLSSDPVLAGRACLAAIYLGWLATTFLLQRSFHYAHVPETFLMLAVFAANRWPLCVGLVLLQVVVGVCLLAADHNPSLMDAHRRAGKASWVYRHFTERNAAFEPARTRLWPDCFKSDPPREVRNDLRLLVRHFASHDLVQLGAVADYLREQNVRDGELIAWHDSPHALYLDLNVKPSYRFMHVGMAASLGPWQSEQVLRELQIALPQARFVVSDLYRITRRHSELVEAGPDGLPLLLPERQRKEFPFNQPVVFRSPGGRYLVHRIVNPVTSCTMPEKLDQKDP